MGDDTPSAVLSEKYRPLSHFFRQNFSQVTNPPIDSLREFRVMSLKTRFGNLKNVLDEDSSQTEILVLDSPFVGNAQWDALQVSFNAPCVEIDCTFPAGEEAGALSAALTRIREEAEDAVRSGAGHLTLTDQHQGAGKVPMPMILATSAVHSWLTRKGLRTFTSLNVRSAECIDPHYFAVLIGCGATVVNAYLAEDSLDDRIERGLLDCTLTEAVARYRTAIDQGLLKIMAKMGISVISSYRGGLNFEAVGLSRAMVAEYFPGMQSRISGIGVTGIQRKVEQVHKAGWLGGSDVLPIGGFYKARRSGEKHAWEAQTMHLMQQACNRASHELWKQYSSAMQANPPIHLRDLLAVKPMGKAIPIDEVESITSIRKRFVTPGMSLGALSPEAHKTLNVAMNRIGAKSDSGEGGEDPAHFVPEANGDNPSAKIKQVASGRFGVTAEYLNQCEELEIKVAQGAKPGEGGQLPGMKVTDLIARLRHSTKGVTLISPPPHHDIYSIEDLAQLIYDLKQINPRCKVTVKLVASSGVGTIAAGVAKAKADVILISGHNGGTGASPATSIKYAGLPWEMGLTEAHQVLSMNNLRDRVTLRTDGGLRTGRDIVMAAMLGAEEYGEKMQLEYAVQNTLRTIGTRTSSHIVKNFGMRNNLQPDHLTVKLKGSAGQSLGAFAAPGLKLEVSGDANDYVGKGLSGGTIVVRPPMNSPLVASDNTIIGNTVLYGATDGYLFAAGRAGERFGVRNSGAKVVIEGCGSNGCEYMTGGVAVILGSIGANFGAGMTGGMAYLYDPSGVSGPLLNMETLVTCPVTVDHWEYQLKGLIERHLAETGSRRAADILQHWELERGHFVQVCPKEMLIHIPVPLSIEETAVPAE
ncbi:UNVERIFIED_CONTAM: hypothetical protein GTU68_059007 [Idotea baltica]|nr:hypothetical protein [Idotea baltica]